MTATGEGRRRAWADPYRLVFVAGLVLLAVSMALGLVRAWFERGGLPALLLDPLSEGKAALERGDARRAVAEFRKALVLVPGEPGMLVEAASGLARAGDAAGAVEAYGKALRVRPDDPEMLRGLGSAYEALGRHREAEEAYLRALARAPGDAKILAGLGGVRLGEDRLAEAEVLLSRALALDPSLATAHNDLGITLSLLGKHTPALRHFEEAHRLDPGPSFAENVAKARAAAAAAPPSR